MNYLNKSLILACVVLLFSACKKDDPDEPIDPMLGSKPNILLIIADDMGLDACPAYDIGAEKPNMPTLESLNNSGIRFNNMWSYPTCTPTRSSILTGKYGFRTNVLAVNDHLSTSETSLQKYISTNTSSAYSQAVIGKWHLSNDANHPLEMGVENYAGFLSGGVQSYWNWGFTENGETNNSTEYTTTKFTDLSIDWISAQEKPWFLWLAYNAPHTPFHLPPSDLHTKGALPEDQASIDADPLPYYLAMLEAMDSEMGRLLNSLSDEERDNTIIIFIGDNGTPNQAAQVFNSNRVKGTLYKGGINVPMIISGKNVSRLNETEDALLNTTDLFATIAELAGVAVKEINDSKSFEALLNSQEGAQRSYIYSEISDNEYTIRNETHKYMLLDSGVEALYNLKNNAFENPNLLSPNQAPLSSENELIKDELINQLIEIRQ